MNDLFSNQLDIVCVICNQFVILIKLSDELYLVVHYLSHENKGLSVVSKVFDEILSKVEFWFYG